MENNANEVVEIDLKDLMYAVLHKWRPVLAGAVIMAVLRGGAVTYCDEIKHRVLGVEQETLDRYTAVSHQTAREMAVGSLELYQSDIAVSATGYAGPGGGTEDDPAGTFYIGWAHRSADVGVPIVDSVRCLYEGDRSCVRAHAVAEALGRIALVLNSME